MIDDRLRLAFSGLHPDSIRSLLLERGASGAVAMLAGTRGNARAAAAVRVDAAVRRSQLEQLGVGAACRGDPEFPAHLAERPDAPDLLFVRGRLPAAPGVAVVGTRTCTRYGLELATEYGSAIGEAGWPLVSGLARGIDGAAHRGTIEVGAVGVGVLGCGIDVSYPPEHRGLGDELVAAGGAVVTEYPPGTPPEGWRFPPRNRIISGLAAAVVVVEAGVRGGALITAGAALEQGVPVFAVPGDVRRASSRGCNLLIRDGAHPVLDPSDLIAELELVLGPARPAQSSTAIPEEVRTIGSDGVAMSVLAERLGLSFPDAVGLVARWEVDGLVRRLGDTVHATSSV